MNTKKDRVYEVAAKLVRQWNTMIAAYVPVKPDKMPGAASILAAVAGPLDDLVALIGHGDEEPEHQAWEYRHVDRPKLVVENGINKWSTDAPWLPPLDGTESPYDLFKKLGAEGWELCTVDDNNLYIFKRPK